MKFMVMHKTFANSETEQAPTQELIDNVGKLLGDAMTSGRFIDADGLRSAGDRVRISFEKGERSVKHGPYEGQNELLSSFAKLVVKSLPEAIEWGTRFGQAAGNVEVEIGLVTEPWDLGMAEKPAGEVPLQVLALIKATPEFEAGAAPSPQQVAATERVIKEATDAGVFKSHYRLLPSAKAARIRGPKGARTVIDGPFSESKELVGGFMMMKFDSKAEAVSWSIKYADIVGAHEVDVREAP